METDGPTLGIAIPSFRQAEYVGETLRSLKQLETPFEAIIRDAGSDDGTLEVIREMVGDDVRFHLDVVGGEGQSEAINRALMELADRHQLITWVNTDDVYLPQAYDRLLAHIWKHPRAAAMFGDFEIIDAGGSSLGLVRRPGRIRRSFLLNYYNAVPGFGMAMRSEAFRQAGLLDTSLDYAMDLDLWLRMLTHGPIVRYPDVVVRYRWHVQAKTAGQSVASQAEVRAVQAAHRGQQARSLAAAQRFAWRITGRSMRAVKVWQEVAPEKLVLRRHGFDEE